MGNCNLGTAEIRRGSGGGLFHSGSTLSPQSQAGGPGVDPVGDGRRNCPSVPFGGEREEDSFPGGFLAPSPQGGRGRERNECRLSPRLWPPAPRGREIRQPRKEKDDPGGKGLNLRR